MKKVGWIFTQSSKERDYIMNTEEICQMAAWQHELGEHCVTGVVSLSVSDEGSDVHFEAFQVTCDTVTIAQNELRTAKAPEIALLTMKVCFTPYWIFNGVDDQKHPRVRYCHINHGASDATPNLRTTQSWVCKLHSSFASQCSLLSLCCEMLPVDLESY